MRDARVEPVPGDGFKEAYERAQRDRVTANNEWRLDYNKCAAERDAYKAALETLANYRLVSSADFNAADMREIARTALNNGSATAVATHESDGVKNDG